MNCSIFPVNDYGQSLLYFLPFPIMSKNCIWPTLLRIGFDKNPFKEFVEDRILLAPTWR